VRAWQRVKAFSFWRQKKCDFPDPLSLSRSQPQELEIFSEYLDLTRFPAARYGDDIVRYLSAKYRTRKPEVLIGVVSTALQFALDHRDEPFPGVPFVFADVDHREVEGKKMPPDSLGSGWLGIIREHWSWHFNCNRKPASSFAFSA
jgi:hypothetical protein